jgi:hypothetical protein
MNSDNKGRMFGLLVLGIIAVCDGSSIFSGVVKSIQSERWPRAMAHVVGSEVIRDGSDVAPRYTPSVEFRYSVGNVNYTSNRIRFLWHRFIRAKSRQVSTVAIPWAAR